MTYVLETSLVVALEKGDSVVVKALEELMTGSRVDLHITAPTYSEVYYGQMGRAQRNRASRRLDSYNLLNTTRESSIILAEIKRNSEDAGKPLPIMDLLTASIVMANGATLLTRDKHFKEISGLDLIVLE